MQLIMNEEEFHLVAELVESRIGELHPTIRRSRVSTVTDSLKHDLKVLEELRQRLESHEAEPVS